MAEKVSKTGKQVFTQTCLNELELQPNIMDAAIVKPPCFILHAVGSWSHTQSVEDKSDLLRAE